VAHPAPRLIGFACCPRACVRECKNKNAMPGVSQNATNVGSFSHRRTQLSECAVVSSCHCRCAKAFDDCCGRGEAERPPLTPAHSHPSP
jgi:hypothetical protein